VSKVLQQVVPGCFWFSKCTILRRKHGLGQSIEAAKISMSVRFPVEMRATPTVTIYSPTTLTAGTFRVWQAGVDRTGAAGFISTTGFASIDKSGAADLSPSSTQNSAVQWIASIEL